MSAVVIGTLDAAVRPLVMPFGIFSAAGVVSVFNAVSSMESRQPLSLVYYVQEIRNRKEAADENSLRETSQNRVPQSNSPLPGSRSIR